MNTTVSRGWKIILVAAIALGVVGYAMVTGPGIPGSKRWHAARAARQSEQAREVTEKLTAARPPGVRPNLQLVGQPGGASRVRPTKAPPLLVFSQRVS